MFVWDQKVIYFLIYCFQMVFYYYFHKQTHIGYNSNYFLSLLNSLHNSECQPVFIKYLENLSHVPLCYASHKDLVYGTGVF